MEHGGWDASSMMNFGEDRLINWGGVRIMVYAWLSKTIMFRAGGWQLGVTTENILAPTSINTWDRIARRRTGGDMIVHHPPPQTRIMEPDTK